MELLAVNEKKFSLNESFKTLKLRASVEEYRSLGNEKHDIFETYD